MNLKLLITIFATTAFLSCIASPVGPVSSSGNAPPVFFLNQNYPNPFTDTTWVPYGVPPTGGSNPFVSLLVFDKYHNLVRTLAYNYHHPAGSFTLPWDGRGDDYYLVPPGIYVIELYGSSPTSFIARIAAIRTK